MKSVFFYDTIVGEIGIAANGSEITNVFFSTKVVPDCHSVEETGVIKEAIKQLDEYFAGERLSFDLPLHYESGSRFQKSVWEALKTIPYGETRSYKEIARLVGNQNAFRAVGGANNKNPIAIIIPCHRVIGSDGKLVGYGGGMEIKAKLLSLEKTHKPK